MKQCEGACRERENDRQKRDHGKERKRRRAHKRITKSIPTLGVGGLRDVEYEKKQCEGARCGREWSKEKELNERRGKEGELIEADDE